MKTMQDCLHLFYSSMRTEVGAFCLPACQKSVLRHRFLADRQQTVRNIILEINKNRWRCAMCEKKRVNSGCIHIGFFTLTT